MVTNDALMPHDRRMLSFEGNLDQALLPRVVHSAFESTGGRSLLRQAKDFTVVKTRGIIIHCWRKTL
jgi:hypothetical protein